MSTKKAILILSPPRSGSTYLARIISNYANDKTEYEDESWSIVSMFSGLLSKDNYNYYGGRILNNLFEYHKDNKEDTLKIYSKMASYFYKQKTKHFNYIDKTPRNIFFNHLLEDEDYIKKVYLVRNPVDLFFSACNEFCHGYYSWEKLEIDLQRGIKIMSEQDNHVFLVRYEDLLNNQADEVNRIFQNLDMDYTVKDLDDYSGLLGDSSSRGVKKSKLEISMYKKNKLRNFLNLESTKNYIEKFYNKDEIESKFNSLQVRRLGCRDFIYDLTFKIIKRFSLIPFFLSIIKKPKYLVR